MATREQLTTALLEAATEVLGEPPTSFSEDSRFEEDLGIDSLDLLEILMILEDEFDFTRDEDSFAGVNTVGAALDALAKVAP